MDSYQTFAEVYDLFMDNVPYDTWCDLYCSLLSENGITSGILLDLGCGTGQMTRRFAAKGFDMIGIDSSPDMLEVAREAEFSGETDEKPAEILYLLQDMREFELYGTVAAVVSVCDAMNYITEDEDLLEVFSLVNNYLDPGGLFLFDMNTVHKYETELADGSFCESRDEAAFLCENTYDPESGINEYDLTLFVRDADGRFSRFEETHYQRAWTPRRVAALLEQAGLELIGIYGEDGRTSLSETDGRMYFAARECSKKW